MLMLEAMNNPSMHPSPGPAFPRARKVPGADDSSPSEAYVLPSVNAPHLSTQEMDALDQTFRARVEETRQASHRLSRQRLWLIFLLLRHGALRLGEVLGLNDATAIDLDEGMLRVRGGHSRDVPLPQHLVPELRQFFSLPPVAAHRGELTHLDPGYVRRNFYARARECGLSPELASPRALRQSRAVELIQGGMPLPAVQKLLGQPSLESTGGILAYTDADIQGMTQHYLQREAKLKTSARNVFPGQVSGIRQQDFLAEVRVSCFSGLEVTALITQESLERMQLARGKTVIATVKSPSVIMARAPVHGAPPPTSARNRLEGTVLRINRSALICSVVARLSEGSRVCALITTERTDELGLTSGTLVTVMFDAFSVILDLP